MATPLGTTFVTDEHIVVQDDVLRKGKMVESLVVEFDQAKYEEFLSSGSKSPKTRVCRRVSTTQPPEAQSVAQPGAAVTLCAAPSSRVNASSKARVTSNASAAINRDAQNPRANASLKARVVHGTTVAAIDRVLQNARVSQKPRVNVSQETRVVNSPGSSNQEVVGFSPPPRRNRNAERRQRRRARQHSVGTDGSLTGVGRGVQYDALPAPRPVREIRVWRPKRETPQVESAGDQLTKRRSEVSASHQTQDACVPRRGAQQPIIFQVPLLQRSGQQCENRVSSQQRRQTRVTPQVSLPQRSGQQCDDRVSSQQRRQTRVTSQVSLLQRSRLQREDRVSSQQRRQTRVTQQCDLRVSETCVQTAQHTTAPRLRRCEASLFNPPPTDLRDYLTRKRSANQATSSCCCQQLIQMLSECHCESGVHQPSLIRQLTLIPPSAKRRRSHRRRTFPDVEYPELTAYMTSRSRGKQPMVNSDGSDSEPEGVYRHTRTRTGAICNAPIPRIRGRYGDVHTRGENTLTRTLSLSTVHNLHIDMGSSMI